MGKLIGRLLNKDGIRLIPGYKDICATKVPCFHDTPCTGCGNTIRKGGQMWHCGGEELRDGKDGNWHDHCL